MKGGSRRGKSGNRSGRTKKTPVPVAKKKRTQDGRWEPPKVPKTFRNVEKLSYSEGLNRFFIDTKKGWEEYEVMDAGPEIKVGTEGVTVSGPSHYRTYEFDPVVKCKYDRKGVFGVMSCGKTGDGVRGYSVIVPAGKYETVFDVLMAARGQAVGAAEMMWIRPAWKWRSYVEGRDLDIVPLELDMERLFERADELGIEISETEGRDIFIYGLGRSEVEVIDDYIEFDESDGRTEKE